MGKRQASRDRIEQRIVELGREQLDSVGAAGLSVRAIARDLGMVSSAVYRYVASRDELLTVLLVDAYTRLADDVERARAAAGPTWTAQFRAVAHAVRDWALAQPSGWALLYGSPVPGYHAPPDITVGPGTRVVGVLFDVVAAGIAAGDVPPTDLAVAAPTAADFDGIRAEFGFPGDDGVLARCLLLWASLVGAVSLEVFGQYGADTLRAPATVFDLQMDLLVDTLTRN